jgi:hypothetical protein
MITPFSVYGCGFPLAPPFAYFDPRWAEAPYIDFGWGDYCVFAFEG